MGSREIHCVIGRESFVSSLLSCFPLFPTYWVRQHVASRKKLDVCEIICFGRCCLQVYLLLCYVHKQEDIIHLCISVRLDKSRWQSVVSSVRPFVLPRLWMEGQWEQSEYITAQLPCCDSPVPPWQDVSSCLCTSSQSIRWQCKLCEKSAVR